MEQLTKIFFGKVKRDVDPEGMDAVSFWDSERFFSTLPNPVSWEHGVLQVYDADSSHIWWTLTGVFQKSLRLEVIQDAIASFQPEPDWADFLCDVFTRIVLESYDAEDFDSLESDVIHVFEDCVNIDLSYMEELQGKQVWVLEVIRYSDPPVSDSGGELQLIYDNSDELDLRERFMLCMLI